VDAFERTVRNIPTVRNVRIGVRLVHGARYEQGMPDTGAFLTVIDFDDFSRASRHTSAIPSTTRSARLFRLSLSSAMVYDFQMGGVELLRLEAGGLEAGGLGLEPFSRPV